MVDINKAKNTFNKYTQKYDFSNKNIEIKYYHSYRVMSLSKLIAESLDLSQEQINIATIIGLLHDIAKFEQYTQYQTFNDLSGFDHGDYAIEILEENAFLREFIEEKKFDDVIKKAIQNHNKFKIEKGLSKKELLYTKIIKDADKLDIFYETVTMFFKKESEREVIENSKINESVLKKIKSKQLVLKENDFGIIDRLMVKISFVFDLNFKCSYEYLLNQDYVNQLIDRFDFKEAETKKQMEEIRKILNEFMKKKANHK